MKIKTLFFANCNDYDDLTSIKEDIRNCGGIIEDSGVDYTKSEGWIKFGLPDDFWTKFLNTNSFCKQTM